MSIKARTLAISTVLAAASVVATGLIGSAEAATLYSCGYRNEDTCTYAVANVGVYTLVHGGSKIYTIPQGAIVEIDRYVLSEPDAVHGDATFYHAKRQGYTWGMVAGYYLATGHDPASGIGYCE